MILINFLLSLLLLLCQHQKTTSFTFLPAICTDEYKKMTDEEYLLVIVRVTNRME